MLHYCLSVDCDLIHAVYQVFLKSMIGQATDS